MRVAVLVFAFTALCASSADAQPCLHGDTETQAQAGRRREALVAARLVNTLQANQPGATRQRYLSHDELATSAPGLPATFRLAPGDSIVAGWRLTLDVTAAGYWFAITDTTDPCGFRYISNEQGLIFTAEPIR